MFYRFFDALRLEKKKPYKIKIKIRKSSALLGQLKEKVKRILEKPEGKTKLLL